MDIGILERGKSVSSEARSQPPIAEILAAVYRSAGGNRAAAVGGTLLAEVTRIIRIYAEGMKVRPVEVISTDVCGMVLTEETATIGGASRPWRGVHRWCFRVRTLRQI